MKSGASPLMALEEALQRVTRSAQALAIRETEEIATFDALGRVLAQDVRSGLDVPPADNTSMDGYAVRCADIQPDQAMDVSQRIAAGQFGMSLAGGTVARIFTGAPVPEGADAVMMQEDAQVLEDGRVQFIKAPSIGQWIRRRGEDIRQGEVVLHAGTRLTPAGLGLAASVGCASLRVLRRPRVALFSTGDELVMPGEPLRPGAIYNSNRFMLKGLLMAAGCEVTDWGIVPDRLDPTRVALREAAQQHDLILTSGGVSVGEEDHLRPALQHEGRIDLWQVAIKPGKPLALGAVRRASGDEALYIGMPGNPVSSYVTFLLFAGPALRAMQGMEAGLPTPYRMRADFEWPKPDRRREFLRVRRNAAHGLELFANQSSGVLTSVEWAEGLVDIAAGQVIRHGDWIDFIPMADLVGR